MRRIGLWRALAGLGLATTIALGATGLIEGGILVALVGAAIAMVVMAERIHHLEREAFGDANDGRVRTRTSWAYWRQPEIVVAIAGTALITIRLAQGPGVVETFALIAIIVAGAIVMRRAHARAWRRSGSEWTEERWRDSDGHEVRQLFAEGQRPLEAGEAGHPLYGKRVYLALRSSHGRIEAFVALSGPGAWAKQRHSRAKGPGPEVGLERTEGAPTERWLEGSVAGVLHAPEAEPVLEALLRDQRLRVRVPCEDGEHVGVKFAGGAGWRRRFDAVKPVANRMCSAWAGLNREFNPPKGGLSCGPESPAHTEDEEAKQTETQMRDPMARVRITSLPRSGHTPLITECRRDREHLRTKCSGAARVCP